VTTSASMSMGMPRGNECRGELLGQSRRGALTDAGRLALDAHLASCASCRLARDVLADFDQVDVVDIRDGARVRALIDAARAAKAISGSRGRARAQRRVRVAAAAAALIICGGSASAAVWWWRRPAPPASETAARPVVTARADAPARVASRPASAAPAAVVVATAPSPRHRAAPRTAASGDTPSAAALLAEAGRARGDGQLDRAASLYRRLQREFPGTPEALVSAVPLGRLLLDGGAARPALAAFDGYLRDVPRGALVAEALYGKGRALELLGARDEERRTWERLVGDHAGSAYVPHAQRRLAALR
jgi:hypothetical protein